LPARREGVPDAVADDDAPVPEPVVVAVDGDYGVVGGSDFRGGLGDVLAEAVVGKGGLERRRVVKHDVGNVVGDGAVTAAGGHRPALAVVNVFGGGVLL
jgi:hypothetical protein